MAQMIPMLMTNPNARKGMSKVAKYMLMFGGLGVAVMVFIFVIKKLNPFKAIGNFFGSAFKNIGGFFGNLFSVFGIRSKESPLDQAIDTRKRALKQRNNLLYNLIYVSDPEEKKIRKEDLRPDRMVGYGGR